MKLFRHRSRAISRTHTLPGLLALGLLMALAFASNAGAAATPVPLGTAGGFAILAGAGVTDVPTSTIAGHVGVAAAPGSSIGGLTCAEVSGTVYATDATGLPCFVVNAGLLGTAANDLTTAYGDAAGRTPDTTFIGADNQLGGQALVPGVYRFPHATTANLIGNLTLNGGPGSVWIFQATSDLVTAVGSSVTFTGGAGPCNVYWQIGSSATINGSSFAGTVMAQTSVTMGNGVTLSGRAMASTGNVTLISDTISASSCSAASIPNPPQPPPREIYCSPAGVAYDLEAGQDKLPPYDKLGLIPAYVDPVTGSKSCTFPAAIPTPVVPTPVAPTPVVPTPVAPTPVAPTQAQKAAAAKRVEAAKKAKAAKAKAAKKKAAAVKAKQAAKKAPAKTAAPGAPPKAGQGGFTG